MTENTQKHRLLGMDALRTLAIAGVVLFHMFPRIVPGGYFGVSLFFVLSGYLLAFGNGNEHRNGRFGVWGYYGKRIKRIYPSLLIMLTLTAGAFSVLAPGTIKNASSELLSVVLGYNNWWQIARQADYFARMSGGSPFTHLWFLGIEMQYYLLWPLLFFVCTGLRDAGRKKLLAFLSVAMLLFLSALMPVLYHMYPDIDLTRLYYGTDTRVYALLLGAALGFRRAADDGEPQNENTSSGGVKAGAFFLCLAIVLAAYKYLDGQTPLVYQGGMLAVTLICCLLVLLAADERCSVAPFLGNSLFRWIGQHSYDIFLWHYPVIFLFHVKKWDGIPYAYAAEIAITLLLAAWSSAFSTFITERRFPRIGHYMVWAQGALFLLLTLCGTGVMGLGCREIAVSFGTEAREPSLKAQLEERRRALEEENRRAEEAARAAREREKEEKRQRLESVDMRGIVCIGDSVLLIASDEVRELLPDCYIDAEVSRYVGGGLEVAKAYEARGLLGDTVVISLGTNGPIAGHERYEEQTLALLEYLGPKRRIFWVNT